MKQDTYCENKYDTQGSPAGGCVRGVGLSIDWQDGPLGRGEDRKEPNGAFVETVISAVLQRIEHYQVVHSGKFSCDENRDAIVYLEEALKCLNSRTKDREAREVERTHKV